MPLNHWNKKKSEFPANDDRKICQTDVVTLCKPAWKNKLFVFVDHDSKITYKYIKAIHIKKIEETTMSVKHPINDCDVSAQLHMQFIQSVAVRFTLHCVVYMNMQQIHISMYMHCALAETFPHHGLFFFLLLSILCAIVHLWINIFLKVTTTMLV